MVSLRNHLMFASLSGRLARRLSLAFVLATAGILLVSYWIGQRALRQEHESAALRVAALFEASLHNAMLKRDLAGLEHILSQLGSLPGVRAAALLNPAGQVRFASDPKRLGGDEAPALRGLCLTRSCTPASAILTWDDHAVPASLRVIYPVLNQIRCAACHGEAALNPVNGVLILDLAALSSEQQAMEQLRHWLLPAVLGVLAVLGLMMAWVLRREVVRPVTALATAVERMANGELSARSQAQGHDELARLGRGLDHMAEQLATQLSRLDSHRAMLQALIDTAPDPIVVIRADHTILLANRAYAKMLGWVQGEVIGQHCHRVSRGCAQPCATTMVVCPLAECAGNDAALRVVMPFAHSDGTRVDVEIHAASLRGESGEPLVVEVIRSLTQDVRFSQEQRLSAIGMLANGVAHEIHNPLASIRLALQSSLRTLAQQDFDRAELVDYLLLVDHEIDRCVLTTQRLLKLSQPPQEQVQPVSVGAAVGDVVALLAEEARQTGVKVVVDIEPADARVMMDESELRQVGVNLVQNAFHAMPQGGVLHILGRAGSGADTGRYCLTVRDTGCGIPLERQGLIFMPFYSQRADGQRGSGLGLAICRTLIEHRGGHISVHSEPGVGSAFVVNLPGVDLSQPDKEHPA